MRTFLGGPPKPSLHQAMITGHVTDVLPAVHQLRSYLLPRFHNRKRFAALVKQLARQSQTISGGIPFL